MKYKAVIQAVSGSTLLGGLSKCESMYYDTREEARGWLDNQIESNAHKSRKCRGWIEPVRTNAHEFSSRQMFMRKPIPIYKPITKVLMVTG